MASKMSERLNFKSVEELLGVVNEEAAMDIEIYKISGFKGHPFKVVDDEKMQELVQAAAELPGKVRHKEQERGL